MSTIQAERSNRSERKARGSGHLRRAELLAAAERIFNASGYEGATIRKIAEEVGVSSTALYMYFQDKSQIMLEICVNALEELNRQKEAVAAETTDPLDRLRKLLELLLRFGFEQPTTYQMLYCTVPKELAERRNAVIAGVNRAAFQRLHQAVQAAMQAGQMRADLPSRAVADSLVAACHGAICIRIANPYAPWTEAEVLSQVLLDGLFQGFGA